MEWLWGIDNACAVYAVATLMQQGLTSLLVLLGEETDVALPHGHFIN